MNKYLAALVGSLCGVFFTWGQEGNYKLLDVGAFGEKIHQEHVQLVDIRTLEEFDQGSIAGAAHIDFYQDDFALKMNQLDKTKPVYIFCKSGGRSAKANEQLTAEGFESVYELKGGFEAWRKK